METNDAIEVMRITKDSITVNPNVEVDDAANAVLNAISDKIKMLVKKAVEEEREAMVAEAAKQGLAMKNEDPFENAVQEIAAIRARG